MNNKKGFYDNAIGNAIDTKTVRGLLKLLDKLTLRKSETALGWNGDKGFFLVRRRKYGEIDES